MNDQTKVNKTKFIKDLYHKEGIKDNAVIYERCQKAGVAADKRFIASTMWAIRSPEDMVERVSVADEIRMILEEKPDMKNREIYSKIHKLYPDKTRKYCVDTAWRIRQELKKKAEAEVKEETVVEAK